MRLTVFRANGQAERTKAEHAPDKSSVPGRLHELSHDHFFG